MGIGRIPSIAIAASLALLGSAGAARAESDKPAVYPKDAPKPGGTIIRFVPPEGKPAPLLSFRILDLVTGEEIRAAYSDPSCIPASVSAYNYPYMLRTICLFPEAPLASGHVFRAEVFVGTAKKQRKLETEFKVR